MEYKHFWNISGRLIFQTTRDAGEIYPFFRKAVVEEERVKYNEYTKLLEVTMKSEKSWITALLLCIFLGELGIHRFYVGKIGTGILYLLTFGLFGIGIIVDIIMIAVGSFTDKGGNFVKSS